MASQRGQESTVTLRLPLTLAIIDGLLVRVGEAFFVLPLASTLECIELTRAEVDQSNGKHVANVRGQLVPYLRLRQYFAVKTAAPEREQIMVVECEEGRCGLVVDEVLGDCQTVIRNLGRLYRHVQVVSGATILGNGTVALILDPQRLVQEAVRAKMQRERGRAPGPGRERESGRRATASRCRERSMGRRSGSRRVCLTKFSNEKRKAGTMPSTGMMEGQKANGAARTNGHAGAGGPNGAKGHATDEALLVSAGNLPAGRSVEGGSSL